MYRSSTMGRRAGWALLLTGLFELALTGGFWFLAGATPDGAGGMLVTAAILGLIGILLLVIGVVLLRRAAATDRISAKGVPGTGQIMGLRQTGMMLNAQPQVELDLLVTIPGRASYRAKVKEIVPLIMLNRLEGTLAVRVDPARPRTVIVQWDQPNMGLASPGAEWGSGWASGPGAPAGFGGPPGAPGSGTDETLGQVAAALAAAGGGAAPVFGQAAQAGYTVEQLRADLRANGLAGTARIDRLDDSGQTVGDERLFTMTTTVTIPGRAPFSTGPSAAMVPLEKVGRIAVGVALPVRVAPDNQDMLMFEWDRI